METSDRFLYAADTFRPKYKQSVDGLRRGNRAMLESWVEILAGMALGAVMAVPARLVCAVLLKKRGLCLRMERKRTLLLAAGMALAGGIIGWRAGISLRAAYLFLLLLAAGCVFCIDAMHRIIPNELVLAVPVLTALFGFTGYIPFSIVSSLTGLAACFVIFFIPGALGRNIGAGDVKFAAAMGFALGFAGSLYAVAGMGVFVLIYLLLGRGMPIAEKLKQAIPMGPFLSLALMAVAVL